MSYSSSFSNVANQALEAGLALYQDVLTLAHVTKESFKPSSISQKTITRLTTASAATALLAFAYSRLSFQPDVISKSLQDANVSSLSDVATGLQNITQNIVDQAQYSIPLPMSYKSLAGSKLDILTYAFLTKTNWFERGVLNPASKEPQPMWFEALRVVRSLHLKKDTKHQNQVSALMGEVIKMIDSLKISWIRANVQLPYIKTAIASLESKELPDDLTTALLNLRSRTVAVNKKR